MGLSQIHIDGNYAEKHKQKAEQEVQKRLGLESNKILIYGDKFYYQNEKKSEENSKV